MNLYWNISLFAQWAIAYCLQCFTKWKIQNGSGGFQNGRLWTKRAAIFELVRTFRLSFLWFWPDLYHFFCKRAHIGPSFRCWNMKTQIFLPPYLCNPLKMPYFDSFCQKYRVIHNDSKKRLSFTLGLEYKLWPGRVALFPLRSSYFEIVLQKIPRRFLYFPKDLYQGLLRVY